MARAKKFGVFGGVFTPSLLAILGVIMFLRLPWIVGQAGLWSALGIILVAHIISVSTGLSISSLATDKRVETGGAYFIISRSLGLPIGGTLGIALFTAFSFSISLYLIGFSEAFLAYFGFDMSLNAIRITGSITLLLITIITFISTSFAIKIQYLIMAALALSLVSVFGGGGHEYYPAEPVMDYMRRGLPWIALFAIFFPAVTGFNTGVSMSGDLKNPHRDIPLGTMMAIFVGLIIYIVLAVFLALTVERELLVNDPGVLFSISWIPQLVVAGIFSATLSSALGSILGGPRILQAVAIDRILPSFLAKGYGASNEPRNALILTFIIAQAGILIGELNVIARIVSIFFIITYGFLNITYAVESWAGSDFRPSFRIPRFVSIIGALACIIVMIQLDVLAMIGSSIVLILIFLWLKKKELTLQTGDTWNSIWASLVKTGLGKLTTSSRKPRNWRPNVILFSGGEKSRPYLVEMGKSLVGNLGIFTNFELIENPSNEILFRKDQQIISDTTNSKARVFTRRHICTDIYEGIDSISKIYGFSGFEPNTILMGWGRRTRSPERFASLLDNFRKLDYNTVFLQYDRNAGYGKFQNIDFWWNGKGRNLSLALTLMRFITSSKEWRSASLRIFVIIRDSSQTESYYNLLMQLLQNYRMMAEVRVINNGVEQLSENAIIHSESSSTDLTILELPEGSRREPLLAINKTNLLTENLRTCLIIQASSSFEEIGLPAPPEPEHYELEEERGIPVPEILQTLKVSSRELVANEVYNAAKGYTHHTQKFFLELFEPIQMQNAEFYKTTMDFVSITYSNLQKTFSASKPEEQYNESLRLLNDFSYYSQRQLKFLKDEVIPLEKEVLHNSLNQYLAVLRHSVSVIPEYLRIKLKGKAFVISANDDLKTKVVKLWKKTQATISRKPVAYKIKVTPAARYYLLYRRLQWVHDFLINYSKHSFSEVAAIRKLFSEVHQSIEISRLDGRKKHKSSERVKLEKSRLLARISVMQTESRDFLINAASQMYETLRDDIQQFNDYLDNPGMASNIKDFKSSDKKVLALQEEIEDFPGVWKENIKLFTSKVLLDFMLLSLKNRILSKIRKYQEDMKLEMETSMLKPMRSYRIDEQNGTLVISGQPGNSKLDTSLLKNPDLPEFFHPLYDEINALVARLPETIAISNPGLIEKIEQGSIEKEESLVINLRKTVSQYLGTELFDKARKQIEESHQQIIKTINTLQDLVRLVNFNLENNPDLNAEIGEQQRRYQNKELLVSFHQRMREEQSGLIKLYRNINKAFEEGLNNAFEPLSSALIGKSNIALKKKITDQPGQKFTARLNQNFNSMRLKTQKQFVNLLYSKSEGMLWVNRFEREKETRQFSNRDLITFSEALSPTPQVLKELPFYYSSLFSGQSGVGEGFWVGMQDEIDYARQAIERFKKGIPGAIIVTGERSSGKSSLCKLITKNNFPSENIYSLRGPKASSAKANEFSSSLLALLNSPGRELHDVFNTMAAGKVFIINDLELWWERRPGGLAVVSLLQNLIDRYGSKCLFIINCNVHSFNIIDNACDLRSYSLATIVCRPFDARELKEIVMLRHQAGGLRFVFDNKDESRMTAWDYARLFNHYFDLSKGNPGGAIALWLASIKKVSGKTLIMESISLPSADVFDQLSQEQLFYALQFVLHRRLTVGQLGKSLQLPDQAVLSELHKLQRAGILQERFQGIYALNRYLDNHIVEKLKSLNLI